MVPRWLTYSSRQAGIAFKVAVSAHSRGCCVWGEVVWWWEVNQSLRSRDDGKFDLSVVCPQEGFVGFSVMRLGFGGFNVGCRNNGSEDK